MMQRKGLVAILAASAVVAAAVLYILLRPNQAPSAEFAAEPSSAIPLAVLFNASKSLDPDGEIRKFAWDFGDGQTGSGQSVQHTYESKGEFIVSLKITDNRGATRTVSRDVVAYEHIHKLPVPKKWESVSKPEISHPPLFTEIEPADGVVVRGTEAWIRWSPGDEAEGRVLWHKAGEAEVRVNAASGTNRLLARLQPLELGQKYEYVVEQISGDFVQRSGLRSFTVEGGVIFDPPVVETTIQRDYDQSVTLTLRNNTKEPIEIAARALKQFDDLPADIVGPGSVDEPIDLPPSEEVALRLAIFAPDANRFVYEVPVEAAGVVGIARVQIAKPEFDVDVRIVSQDPHTLAETIEIVNNGQTLSDLAVSVVPPNEGDLRLNPTIRHAYLSTGEALQVVVSPILYLEFERLNAELRVSAAGQSTGFPLEFKAPEGQRLISVRSQSQKRKGGKTHRCTNRGSSCDEVDGTPDYGPYVPAADIMSEHATAPIIPEPFRVTLSNKNNKALIEQTSVVPIKNDKLVNDQLHPQALPMSNFVDARLTRQLVRNQISEYVLVGINPSNQVSDVLLKQEPGVARYDMATLVASEKQRNNAPIILAQASKPSEGVVDGREDAGGPPNDERGCCPVSKPCSPEDVECKRLCVERAQQLRHQFEVLKAELNVAERRVKYLEKLIRNTEEIIKKGLEGYDANIRALPHARRKLEWKNDQIATGMERLDELRRRWTRLKYCCPMIGNLSTGEGDTYTGPFDYKTSEGKTNLLNWARKLEYQALQAKNRLYKDEFWCELLPTLSVGIEIEGFGSGAEFDLSSLCGNTAERQTFIDLLEQYAQDLRDLAEDPPTLNFESIYKPEIAPLQVAEADRSPSSRANEAIAAMERSSAYFRAHTASLERYQGARLTDDADAMSLQAAAMVRYMRLAKAEAARATELWYQFEKRSFYEVVTLLEQLRANEVPWRAKMLDFKAQIQIEGLSPRVWRHLNDVGISDLEIADLYKEWAALTPERFENYVETRRVELEMIANVRAKLFLKKSKAIWPESPHVEALDHLEYFAQSLLIDAEAMRNQDEAGSGTNISYESLYLPPGLLGSLGRRASFTREHRGSLAVPIVSAAGESPRYAVGWYGGDRVLFAWHQQANQVVFAAFDPRGEPVITPHVVGKGRWPRLAADGQRTAVAFLSVDGFFVRVHEGERWGEQIPLNGGEAAIAFASGGPLYAATSTGLWKLTDGRFELVRQATYAQPALAVDRDGTPLVAWRQNGRILFEGKILGAGERPSIVVAQNGTIYLAYLSKGSLVRRSRDGGQWSEPQTIVAKEKNPSWPTLALGDGDEVRVTYIGDAEHGPPALWLVRRSDEYPILVPSLAGNVTDAWLMLKFSLNDARTRYRRHDMLVTVNDVWIKLFENTVPEGRYLFRLDPRQIFYSPRRPAPNRIAILNWDMNNGNYIIASDYELIVRTAWSEYFGFASNGQEVIDAAHATWRITHDQPDLVVLANNLDLPVEAPVDSVDFPITVANLGEADAQPARLIMLSGDARLATADIPLLKPEEQTVVNLRLKGTLERVRFEIEQDERDFDPDNDVLDLALWRKEDYTAVRGQSPELPTEPEVTLVPTPNDVQPPWVSGQLPAGAMAVGDWKWDLTPSFNAPRSHTGGNAEGRSLHYFIGASEILPLAPGDNLVQYVYLDPQAPPEQILLQLFVEGRKEGQAVYWGGAGDVIRVGGENAKRLGDLPEPGQWVRLRVPVEMLGMKNAWINGLLFGQYGGRAHWGPTAKSISRLDRTEGVMIVSER